MRSDTARDEAEMGDASVVANGLGKTYRLGELVRLERTLKWLIGRGVALETFEALDSVTFATYPAECFGIVGTNGSGKSTVMQILAGITAPTEGSMRVRGSVLPLLAVGAGFHGELTGRENSFLFGTILGLPRKAIEQRLDAIAEFAELGRHFETPVKRFSSGMSSRLCFAIAMLFPADVYCFDEVLAVVDGEFRDRCLNEIRSLVARGSTVLFVSHDLNQVTALCNRVMWLDHGRVQEIGPGTEVVERYADELTHRDLADPAV
jgi:ABC-type polysaccharide/polyol phosphate transport system ATPase subunit